MTPKLPDMTGQQHPPTPAGAAPAAGQPQADQILNDLPESIARYTPDGVIAFVNRSFATSFGGAPASFVGRSVYDVIPPESRPALADLLASLTPAEPLGWFETPWTDSAGRPRWGRSAIQGIFDAGGRLVEVQGAGWDVTEQRERDEELLRYREQLEDLVEARTTELERQTRLATGLAQITLALNSSLDLPTILRAIIAAIREARPRDVVARISLREGDELVLVAGTGPALNLPNSPSSFPLRDDRWPGPQAFQTGEIVCHNDLSRVPDWPGHALNWPWKSQIAVPLRRGEESLGVLFAASETKDAYPPEDVDWLRTFAAAAALALANARHLQASQDKATTAERERMSRELHDSVTQSLFSASLMAQALPEQIDKDPALARALAAKLAVLNQGALGELRELLTELRPALLDTTPLDVLLGHLCNASMARARLTTTLRLLGEPVTLPPPVRAAFYRVTQEALNNVVKHAGATRAEVLLRYERRAVILSIRDDGHGFEVERTAGGTLGMASMRERAEAVGATIAVQSARGVGTEVILSWKPA